MKWDPNTRPEPKPGAKCAACGDHGWTGVYVAWNYCTCPAALSLRVSDRR